MPVLSLQRIASPEDILRIKENREHEKDIVREVKAKTKEAGLDMKIVDAEWQFDRSRLSIYFSAPPKS